MGCPDNKQPPAHHQIAPRRWFFFPFRHSKIRKATYRFKKMVSPKKHTNSSPFSYQQSVYKIKAIKWYGHKKLARKTILKISMSWLYKEACNSWMLFLLSCIQLRHPWTKGKYRLLEICSSLPEYSGAIQNSYKKGPLIISSWCHVCSSSGIHQYTMQNIRALVSREVFVHLQIKN